MTVQDNHAELQESQCRSFVPDATVFLAPLQKSR